MRQLLRMLEWWPVVLVWATATDMHDPARPMNTVFWMVLGYFVFINARSGK